MWDDIYILFTWVSPRHHKYDRTLRLGIVNTKNIQSLGCCARLGDVFVSRNQKGTYSSRSWSSPCKQVLNVMNYECHHRQKLCPLRMVPRLCSPPRVHHFISLVRTSNFAMKHVLWANGDCCVFAGTGLPCEVVRPACMSENRALCECRRLKRFYY